MRCLNRQRANIVFSSILERGEVLGPSAVSLRERVFEHDGVLRWTDDVIVGYSRLGVSLQELLGRIGRSHKQTGSLDLHNMQLSDLVDVFADEAYILWIAASADEALIVLKKGCTPFDQLKAWAHALLLAKRLQGRKPGGKPHDKSLSVAQDSLSEIRQGLEDTRNMFTRYAGALTDKGWDLDIAALETRAGTRAEIESYRKIEK